ncbi:ATP-binding protein, partial [Aliarcobacter butzleri]|uniref:AlbA family DNA-binding domain-containing protein n=1 Tax=Aliarcobacter butzleri TaxID=28197 RepID=UPI00263F0F9E
MKLQINESQASEFKQIWKDELLKTICAFANAEGGKLYIGVDDDGNIIGIEDVALLVESLPNKINNRLGIIADMIAKSSEGKSYIEVSVHKTFTPISYGGKFYQRSGSNTIELNGSNLNNFLLKRFGKTWDDVIEERFSIE